MSENYKYLTRLRICLNTYQTYQTDMSIFNTVMSALRSLTGRGDRDRQSTEPPSRGTVSVEYDPANEESDTNSKVDSHDEAVATSASGDDIIPEPRYKTEQNPDPSTEATIKGAEIDAESQTSDDTDDVGKSPTDRGDKHPAATDTDASASTASLVEEATGKEPAEAVETTHSTADTEVTDSDANAGAETPTDAVGAETDASASTASLINEATGKEPAETVVATGTIEHDEKEGSKSNTPQSIRDINGIGSAYEERLSAAGVDSVAALADSEPTVLADTVDIAETRIERWIEQAQPDGEME
ncbi:MAG: hypothetical protein J07HQW1_00463 [Haloquadratum walsbyi J07HQW1]|uniref:Helix-hairpin-helix domain-containing protein n=1 Tax=Haloquadratum walsbyi J07HQW1 TaxID=1238424 RepID=U1PA71_9EURY|nr:MAG: hypothetical protein J07HQW1_00463 [Haloquadratum walsbyi J07HQW1]